MATDILISAHGRSSASLDGSSAEKLDRIVERLPEGASIRLGAGTFHTHGLPLKRGQSLRGAGIQATTLRLLSAPKKVYQHAAIKGVGDGVTVEDLTVDANWEGIGSPRIVVNIIELYGSDCTIRAVRGIRPYGDRTMHPAPSEGFALCIASLYDGTMGPVRNALIEDCLVEKINGDYVNAIALVNGGRRAEQSTRGIIRNCRVNDGNWIAFSLNSGELHHCVARRCHHLWRWDTGRVVDLVIRDNQSLEYRGLYGIHGNPLFFPEGGSFGRNFVLERNFFMSDPRAETAQAVFFTRGGATADAFDGLAVRDNVFLYTDGAPRPEQQFFNADPAIYQNVSVTGNVSNGQPLESVRRPSRFGRTWNYARNFTSWQERALVDQFAVQGKAFGL